MDPEAHVLVVDDDGEIRQLIAKFLRQNGYRVTTVRDGREMMEAVRTVPINLIILDVMMPGASGLDLCRELRRTSPVPIIMISAKGEETDRVVGLEIGADDYLAKPFAPRELLARVRAVLRRALASPGLAGQPPGRLVQFAGWTLDLLRRELTSPEGVAVDLSTGEYDLLLAFIENPQRVLSRDQLLDLAKNRVSAGIDRTIDIQISRLRRKIDCDPTAAPLVKTIRGTGYIFTPTVTRG